MTGYQEIHWLPDAEDYAQMYGLDKKDCELIVANKSNPSLDPSSADAKYLIVRYKAGDVVVVASHRDPKIPMIMHVNVLSGQKIYHHGGPGKGTDSMMPKSMSELRKRIIATGCTIHMTPSGHLRVIHPSGVFVISLSSTPSDNRTIGNDWFRFNKKMRKIDGTP